MSDVKEFVEHAKQCYEAMDWRSLEGLVAGLVEHKEKARNQALDDAIQVVRDAAQRAVDKEYHTTFALLLMLASDIDELKSAR